MTNEKINICKTDKDKSFWLNQDYVSKDLKKELSGANILFLPESWRNDKNIAFHSDAYPFYEFLDNEKFDGLNIGFCIDEDKYQEIHLHSDIIYIGTLLIEYLILPVFINLFSTYLSTKLFHNPDDEINFKLLIQKENETIKFEYHGNIDKFNELINNDKFYKLIEKSEDD